MSKARRSAAGSKQRRRGGSGLTLATANRMLPLVRHIVEEVQARWNRVAQLEKEQADLEQRRRNLHWPDRSRRYGIGEEIAAENRQLHDAVSELEQLQVVLLDPAAGEVAFPTSVNGRRAYFLWQAGQEAVSGWCYANESARHAIPASWQS